MYGIKVWDNEPLPSDQNNNVVNNFHNSVERPSCTSDHVKYVVDLDIIPKLRGKQQQPVVLSFDVNS